MSDGDVTIVGKTIDGEDLNLYQKCVYPQIIFELGEDWKPLMTVDYEFWLTSKDSVLDTEPLFDVSGDIHNAGLAQVSFPLTGGDNGDTDQVVVPNGIYQIMVKKTDDSETRIALVGKLIIDRTLKAV